MDQVFTDSLAAWGRATSGWVEFWIDTNRRLLAANRSAAELIRVSDESATDEPAAVALPAMDYRMADWAVERNADDPGDIHVGTWVTFSKRLTDEDVRAFARASGDTNRLHLDESFAGGSRFGDRIVHGTLVAGTISAALARLPGLVIYLSQDVEYLAPVSIGERVTARVEVVETLGDGRYRLTNVVEDEAGEAVISGEAVVLVDEMPE